MNLQMKRLYLLIIIFTLLWMISFYLKIMKLIIYNIKNIYYEFLLSILIII